MRRVSRRNREFEAHTLGALAYPYDSHAATEMGNVLYKWVSNMWIPKIYDDMPEVKLEADGK